MTAPSDFDRDLTAWLEARAQPYAPQHLLDASMARTTRVRPRPAWRIPERWIPMPVTLRLAVAPRAVVILLLLSALIAMVAAGAIIGGQLNHQSVPAPTSPPAPTLAPTGPAGNGLIAYDSAGDIWVVNQDGKNARKLIQGPELEHSPVWSRDGLRLAYWSQKSPTDPSHLMVATEDGSDSLIIFTDAAGRVPWSLDWSPDGQHVAFSLCTADDPPCDERMFVVPTDGSAASGAAPVGDAGLTAIRPVWSPKGDLLAFSANKAGLEAGIYVMPPDGSGTPQRISHIVDDTPYAFFTVGWSADGTSIVTQASSGTDTDVWVVPVAGGDARDITLQPGEDGIPKWSPDGTSVAYLANGLSDLTIVPGSGGTPRTLVGSAGGTPTWSPDGTKLAVGQFNGTATISVVDAVSGTKLASIATPDQSFPEQAHYPSWQRVAP